MAAGTRPAPGCMRELDDLADAGYPDTGGYLLLETELKVVRKIVADLRRFARQTKAGAP